MPECRIDPDDYETTASELIRLHERRAGGALPAIAVEQHRIFVHAGVDPTLPLDFQIEHDLLWARKSNRLGYQGRFVVHGHTPHKKGPITEGQSIDLDTLAWHTGRLVFGVFNDDQSGGPIDHIEVRRAAGDNPDGMKLHIFSDLHEGFPRSWRPELAAGAVRGRRLRRARRGRAGAAKLDAGAATPIITMAGNHSFYGRAMDAEWEAGRAAAGDCGVTLLENEAAVICGVRFVGATLWTDYAMAGDRDRGPAMARAAREMNDRRVITWRANSRERFMPAHASSSTSTRR